MAKCNKCGRKGLFLKVNTDGICKNCEEIIAFEKTILEKKNELSGIAAEIATNNSVLSGIKAEISSENDKLSKLKFDRNQMYDDIREQAKADAFSQINSQISSLNDTKENLKTEIKKAKSSLNSLQVKCKTIQIQYDSYRNSINNYNKYGRVEDDSDIDVWLTLQPTVTIDLQSLNIKQLRKLFKENDNLIQKCFDKYSNRYTTKTISAMYMLMTIALKSELQNVLYKINYGNLDESIECIKTMCKKYYGIATEGNQTIAPTLKKFINEIDTLFSEAVKIEHEYYVQRERIKEEQRAIREQMRQEAEERKALEQERKRIEREELKFTNEIENLKIQLKSASEEKTKALHDRIAELERQINEIEEKREQIATLENGKAGYVYIISNIGSFGNDVYKIGMTRRMEPMERINELGSASVPFPFDVHGLIFSDDAVGLEHELHTVFNGQRVNKVNLRKEFFKISLEKIEEIVTERYPTAEFRKTALAEQYRQSLIMSNPAEEILNDDDDVYDENDI